MKGLERSKPFLLINFKVFNKNRDIIFYDESTFNNTKRTPKLWKLRNGNVNYITQGRMSSKHLLLAISKKKILHHEIRTKTTNSKAVLKFIKDLIEKMKNNEELSGKLSKRKLYLILDNASYHKDLKILNYCKENKLNLIFLMPYSQNYNIIEKTFALLKRRFYNRVWQQR